MGSRRPPLVLVVASMVPLAACTLLSGADDLRFSATEEAPATSAGDASAQAETTPPEHVDEQETTPPDVDGGITPPPPDDGGAVTDGAPPDASCAPTAIGPRYATASDGRSWFSSFRARAPDGIPAHSGNGALNVSAFGFSIPAASLVVGVKVEIARSAFGPISDVAVSLPVGTPKANPGAWPIDNAGANFPKVAYGGPSDTWGAALTPGAVNATTFGVTLTVTGAGDGHVDSIGVTIYTCP